LLLVIHAVKGPRVISRFKIVPGAAQILPSRVRRFDEHDLFLAPPPFQLLFSSDRVLHLLVRFEPDEPIAVVTRSKPLMLPPFVLEDPFVKICS
jgi:hypothetical protein